MLRFATGPETLKLGDLEVRRLGFGAMRLPGKDVWGEPADPAAAHAVLHRAIELGINLIDTAWYYGPHVANRLIAETLHPYPSDLVIATKLGARRLPNKAWVPSLRPEELRAGVEANLRSLAIERVDAVNLRLLGEAEVPLADQLGELAALRDEGKLRHIGISNVSREQAEEALELEPGIVCVQNDYNVLERGSEDLLELCREREMAFVPFFPLGSAFTGGPAKLAADPAVSRVAARHGATPAQVALAWLLARDERILLIPGTSTLIHLEENIAAADVALDAEDLAALDDVGARRTNA